MDTENRSPSRRAELKRVAAEEARRSKDAAVARAGREAQLDIERRREELALQREQRLIKAQEKRERKANRRKAHAARVAKLRNLTPVIGRRFMIVGPITAPMAVAWVGQIQFATYTLAWPLVFALVFAAAWELTTAFAGWMYHQARKAGDSGLLFRVATWLFAASAGAMNYWHASPTIGGEIGLSPTPKAVSYGAMSLVGIALWELYSSLTARQELRRRGVVPQARPRFGVARWMRYPGITWAAWSLTIRYGITTTHEAWDAAVREIARKELEKAGRGRAPITLTVVRGPRTRVSTKPMTTWTQPPAVWIPTGKTTKTIPPFDHQPPGRSTTPAALETTTPAPERPVVEPTGTAGLSGTGHAGRPVVPVPSTTTSDHRSTGVERPATTAPKDRSLDHPSDHPSDQPSTTETTARSTTSKTTPKTTSTTGRKNSGRPGNGPRTSRPTAEENAEAVARYLKSVSTGNPLSDRDLANMYGRSKGWGRDRKLEAGPQVVGRPRPVDHSANDHPNDQRSTSKDHNDHPVSDHPNDRPFEGEEATG